MTDFINNLHPDDLLFFDEVRLAMARVAKRYDLPLRTVTPLAMPANGMADRMGDCSWTGDIRLVLRCTVDGAWCDAPLSPAEVWDTAAHELAHLRHYNHGLAHAEFTLELLQALRNAQPEDHREKVLRKLVKMHAQREDAARRAEKGEATAEQEAEAFAAAINRMMIENELNPTDIDYARTSDHDPIVELKVDLAKYQIKRVKTRVAWQESLARIVAKGHLCSFLLAPGTNLIWFVGTKSHATVAEYVYGLLVPAAFAMSERARRDFRNECRRKCNYTKMDGFPEAYGYREAWLNAFVKRIEERLEEARNEAVKQATERIPSDIPGATSTALMRLDGALARTKKYIDDKFNNKRSSANPLSTRVRSNAFGSAAGREAANRMPLGRRGVEGRSGAKGLLR